jgi:hypothetical protein
MPTVRRFILTAFCVAIPALACSASVEPSASWIFPAPLPLAIGSAANKLLGMITGELKRLLAIAAGAATH